MNIEKIKAPEEEVLDVLRKNVDAVRMSIQRGETVPEHFLTVVAKDGLGQEAVLGVGMEWVNNESKRQALREAGGKLLEATKMFPAFVVLMAESWYLASDVKNTQEAERVEKELISLGLENHPQRRECYMFQALTFDGRDGMAFLPFEKLKDGQIRIIEDDAYVHDHLERIVNERDLERVNLLKEFYAGAYMALRESGYGK